MYKRQALVGREVDAKLGERMPAPDVAAEILPLGCSRLPSVNVHSHGSNSVIFDMTRWSVREWSQWKIGVAKGPAENFFVSPKGLDLDGTQRSGEPSRSKRSAA